MCLSKVQGTQGGTGFGALNQSIMHYQRKHRVALAQRLVTVHGATTLAEVLATMARERVHRVFLVEGGMLPRGLVTQTDVCRVLAERLSGQPFSDKAARKLMQRHTARPLAFPLLFPPKKE
jgi:CBS domain-containing protein